MLTNSEKHVSSKFSTLLPFFYDQATWESFLENNADRRRIVFKQNLNGVLRLCSAVCLIKKQRRVNQTSQSSELSSAVRKRSLERATLQVLRKINCMCRQGLTS